MAEPRSFGNLFQITTCTEELTYIYIYLLKYTSIFMHTYTHIDSVRKPNLPFISKGQCLGPRHSLGVQRHGPYQWNC